MPNWIPSRGYVLAVGDTGTVEVKTATSEYCLSSSGYCPCSADVLLTTTTSGVLSFDRITLRTDGENAVFTFVGKAPGSTNVTAAVQALVEYAQVTVVASPLPAGITIQAANGSATPVARHPPIGPPPVKKPAEFM